MTHDATKLIQSSQNLIPNLILSFFILGIKKRTHDRVLTLSFQNKDLKNFSIKFENKLTNKNLLVLFGKIQEKTDTV
jgi:hypothetical protein